MRQIEILIVLGIKPNDSADIDSQIEKFLKQASSFTVKHKDTPFVTLKKEEVRNTRNQLLANYYKEVRIGPVIE
jgi:hypothetical protein